MFGIHMLELDPPVGWESPYPSGELYNRAKQARFIASMNMVNHRVVIRVWNDNQITTIDNPYFGGKVQTQAADDFANSGNF